MEMEPVSVPVEIEVVPLLRKRQLEFQAHSNTQLETIRRLEAELTEARALIKRHEDALEWLSETPDYDSLHKKWQIKMYALCRIGYPDRGITMAMTTPLAAIEAAKFARCIDDAADELETIRGRRML